jgi:hypothetical protein
MSRPRSASLEPDRSPAAPDDRRPRVLLVHSYGTEGLVADAELNDLARVIHVPDVSLLEAQLADTRGELVVCEWTDGLGKLLERPGPPFALVHFGFAVPDGLLEVIAQGHEVQHVETRSELYAFLRARRPPRGRAHAAHLADLTVHLPGDARAHALADLGSDGLAFEVASLADAGPFLPGAHLPGIELRRGEQVVLADAGVHVRQLVPLPEGGYRVGGELEPAAHPPAPKGRVLRGRAVVAGLLRGALEHGLELIGPDETRWCSAGGTLDPHAERVVLPIGAPGLDAHDVVRGHFELASRAYTFTASIVSRAPLTLRLPAQVIETGQRQATRFRPDATSPIVAELDSPLAPRPILRELHDISAAGLAIDFDPEADAFPIGLRLPAITLTLAGERFRCRGVVRQVARVRERRARAGIELDGLSVAERGHLADLVTRAQFADLHDASGTPAEALHAFFRASGFVPAEREAALAPLLPAVQRTFTRVLAAPNRLLKSVVCREDGRLVGHIASVRAHRRTYTVQHLAAAVGREVGLVLSLGNCENLIQNADFDHLKIWFHAHNRFPARVFGSFARKVQDPEACHLATHAHLTLPLGVGAPCDGELVVREADDDDLAAVERHFVATLAPILLRSDDLTRGALRLTEVQAGFAALGLERRRRVLVAARTDGTPLGFALCEHASPGLNLFDSLNRFGLHVLPAGEADDARVRRALLAAVQGAYATSGRAQVSALVAPDEVARYHAIGLALDDVRSMCVTIARAELPRFLEHMLRLGVRLTRRAAGTGRLGRGRATVTVVPSSALDLGA